MLHSRFVPTLVAGVLLVGFPFATPVVAQQPAHLLYTFDGDSAGDLFGSALSAAGDVNLDGFPDIIVGARADDNKGSSSGSARVLSGRDGRVLYTFDGDAAGDQLGYSVSGAGDVNRDGFADVIVGAPFDDNKGTNSGMARVLSGLDGKVLYSFDGDAAGDLFGYSVGGAGDVNKDTYADVIVGARDGNSLTGMARILSGKDGTILFTFNGDSSGDRFGTWVSGAGDVNLDSHPDVIVGAPFDDNNGSNSGMARVLSGKDGTILYTFNGDSAGDTFGICVSGAGDVNRDAFADVVVGANGDDNNGANSGSCRVFSGLTGKVLFTFDGDAAGHALGWTVSGAGDVNKDGYADVIAGKGAISFSNDLGYSRVISGKDGKSLYKFMGYQVSGGEDINRDGYADVITGTWVGFRTGARAGIAWAVSGKELTLRSDKHMLPLTGGTQSLTVEAGSAQANRLYWIFGSITGTHPGVTLAGVHIPLNPDAYTDLALANVTAAPFKNFRGTLSSAGSAIASLVVPTLSGGAFTVYHAYLVYDTNGTFYVASNPVSLRLR